MNMKEAKRAVSSLINPESAGIYAAQEDKMIWVEDNIMQPSGIDAAGNTGFGERLCDWIEDQLDEMRK